MLRACALSVVSPQMSEILCTDDTQEAAFEGGRRLCRIYAPDGSPIGETLAEDQEGLVYANIDLGMISRAKAAADPAGHYARPDVHRLLLNKTPGDRFVSRATQEPAQESSQVRATPVANAGDVVVPINRRLQKELPERDPGVPDR